MSTSKSAGPRDLRRDRRGDRGVPGYSRSYWRRYGSVYDVLRLRKCGFKNHPRLNQDSTKCEQCGSSNDTPDSSDYDPARSP